MERMLACRVGELNLFLPFDGMERLVPWFDVEYRGDRVRWGDEEIPLLRLDECLGFSVRDPALDAGIAVLQIHEERMAVLADRFLGLVEVDLELSFRVPLNWILKHPGLPYRAIHMAGDHMVPEVAPFHLLVRKDPEEEEWPEVRGEIRDAPGRYLGVTVDGISAAVPLEAVEHVVDGEVLIRLPGLPKTILGMLHLHGRPIPVAQPLPKATSAVAVVILKCSEGLLGLAVDSTHGMVELSSQEDPVQEEDQEPPPFLGGCDLLSLDPLGNIAFTLDPERVWEALG